MKILTKFNFGSYKIAIVGQPVKNTLWKVCKTSFIIIALYQLPKYKFRKFNLIWHKVKSILNSEFSFS